MEPKSSNYEDAFKKFADWIESNEKRVNSACHCCPQLTSTPLQPQQQSNGASPSDNFKHNSSTKTPPTPTSINATTRSITQSSPTTPNHQQHPQTWKHVILYHQNLQNEVEDLGKQLNCELKRLLHDEKSPSKSQIDQSQELEARWHKLWLKSLEQLVVVERTRRCPKHNSTIIGKSSTSSPASKSVSRLQRRRPISYPNNVSERLEWDYQPNTLSLTGSHKENGSQIDLDSVDEQVTKNLTEFGENYEMWLADADEVSDLQSRPPSPLRDEQPIIAKADPKITDDSSNQVWMITTPSAVLSVDATKCSHIQKQSNFWRIVGPCLLAIAFVAFSALYSEPHHMHKSYYHTQPPV